MGTHASDSIVFLNGAYLPLDEARVSILDHGFLYGDGVFESLVVVGGRVFRLDDHLERRAFGAGAPPRASARTRRAVRGCHQDGAPQRERRLLRPDDRHPQPWLPVLDPRAAEAPTLVVFTHPLERPATVADSYREDGMRLKVVAVRKTRSISLEAQVKSLNYLNQILARMEALEAGADEALLLDVHGLLADGPGENVFAVHGAELLTPPVHNVLAGITRRTLIDLAAGMGHSTTERAMTLYDLYAADEVFLSSTFGGVLPVTEVDGYPIGRERPGPLTRALRERYERVLRESGTPIGASVAAEG